MGSDARAEETPPPSTAMTVVQDHPPHHGMSPREYLSTRVSSLQPPPLPLTRPPNPIRLLRSLNRRHWAFFLVAFAAWTWDAFDFFTVSLTVTDLANDFGRSKTDITWGITLVLMFRSVGSVIFGIASDRYGRKWPFIVNNVLFIILELVCSSQSFFCLLRQIMIRHQPVTSMVRRGEGEKGKRGLFGPACFGDKHFWLLRPRRLGVYHSTHTAHSPTNQPTTPEGKDWRIFLRGKFSLSLDGFEGLQRAKSMYHLLFETWSSSS